MSACDHGRRAGHLGTENEMFVCVLLLQVSASLFARGFSMPVPHTVRPRIRHADLTTQHTRAAR